MSSDLNFSLCEDYEELTNPITGFEAYMFASTDYQAQKHDAFESYAYVIEDGDVTSFDFTNQALRKKGLTTFNKAGVNVGIQKGNSSVPNASRLSCMIVYIEDPDGLYRPKDVRHHYDILAKALTRFCKENHRIACIVPHLHQGQNMPHAHILVQRARGKHNEFQEWLIAHSDEF